MNDDAADSQSAQAREIIEYLEIPLRRPLLVLIPFLVCSVLGALLFYNAQRWYKSSTLILVESESVPASLVPQNVMDSATAVIRRLKQEILSRTRLERIAKELDPYPDLADRASAAVLVEKLRETIDITQKGGDAFLIEFEHQNPYLAMAVTNRLATLFIEEASNVREQKLAEVHKFLETQLESARQELEAKEQQIRMAKLKNEGALPEQLGTNLSTLQRLQVEKQTAAENLRAMEERRIVLETRLAEEQQRDAGAANATGETPDNAKLLKMMEELQALRLQYRDEYPEVKRLKKRIERMQLALASTPAAGETPAATLPKSFNPAVTAFQAQLDDTRIQIDRLKQGLQSVTDRIAFVEKQVERTPQVEAELIALTRDYGKIQNNFTFFQAKKADAEMTEKLESQWKGLRFKTLDPAYLPTRPDKPKLIIYLGGGLAAGVLLGLFAAVAAEVLDNSFRTASEVSRAFPQPVIVTLPHLKARRRARPQRQLVESET